MDTEFKARGSAEDGNIVTIYTRKVLNNFKTKEQEDFVFDFIPFITIVSPGQKHSVVDTKVNADHKKRYPKHWEAYENKVELRDSGIELSKWMGIENSLIPELESLNIFTVEDLAATSDTNLENIGPGARKLRERAEEHLSNRGGIDAQLGKALKRIDELEKLVKDAPKANPVKKGKQDDATNDSPGLLERIRGV